MTDEVPPTPALHAGLGERELGASFGSDRRDGRLLPDPAAGRAALFERARVGGDHPGRVFSTNAGRFTLQPLEHAAICRLRVSGVVTAEWRERVSVCILGSRAVVVPLTDTAQMRKQQVHTWWQFWSRRAC